MARPSGKFNRWVTNKHNRLELFCWYHSQHFSLFLPVAGNEKCKVETWLPPSPTNDSERIWKTVRGACLPVLRKHRLDGLRMDSAQLLMQFWLFDQLKVFSCNKTAFHHMESRQLLSWVHVMRTCLADENFSAITALTITLTWISFSLRANSGVQLCLRTEPNCSPCLWSLCLPHTGGVTHGKSYIMFRHRQQIRLCAAPAAPHLSSLYLCWVRLKTRHSTTLGKRITNEI